MKEENKSELVLYQTEDGKTRLEVRLHDETAWLTSKKKRPVRRIYQKKSSLQLKIKINNSYA